MRSPFAPIIRGLLAAAFLLAPIGMPSAGTRDAPPTNILGMPVLAADGTPINYSRDALDGQPQVAVASPDRPSQRPSAQGQAAVWQYAAFGSGIGKAGIVVDDSQGQPEIYLAGSTTTFGADDYWYALTYDPGRNAYTQSHVSRYFPGGIQRLAIGDLLSSGGAELAVALTDGQVVVVDAQSHRALGMIATTATSLNAMTLADIDGDELDEILLATASSLLVYDGDGNLVWDLVGVGGDDLIAAQLDADPALEIALTDGTIVDSATRSVQWRHPGGFGFRLQAADIDGDGMDELVAAETWSFVWAYDVDTEQAKWSLPAGDIDAIHLAEVDGDSSIELLLGEGQWGDVLVYDTVTLALEASIDNPQHGVTRICTADVDQDDVLELLWGAGATSTVEDHLYVADMPSGTIEWQNIHLDGPFLGPRSGDLDGDGLPELVTATWESESGYGSGRILVFDGSTLALRAISDGIVGDLAWTGAHDLELRDVDGDERMEILVAADRLYDGVIEVYDFSADNQFSLAWTNAVRPVGAPFYSVDAADVDGDDQMEIIGGGGRQHAGADGVFVYVYDYASGLEEWRSFQLGGPWDSIDGLGVINLDLDPALEIAALAVDAGDLYVFDGVSKIQETLLYGEYETLTPLTVAGGAIALTEGSDLSVLRDNGAGYTPIFAQSFGPTPIDGLAPGPSQLVLLGSDGALSAYTLSGVEVWRSQVYGDVFGADPLWLPTSQTAFASGTYSLAGFER